MGSVQGAIGGSVDALVNGRNFAKGFYTGGLAGAAMAAVSYTVNYFITSRSITSYMEASDENILSEGTPVGNRSYARDLYKSQFGQQKGLSSNDIYNRAVPGGTMNAKTGLIEYYEGNEKIEALGVTNTKKDFISGKIKSKIYLANKAFNSREQLAYVLQHELNHVRIHWSDFASAALNKISFKIDEPGYEYRSKLNNVGHYYIEESGTNFISNNGWQNMRIQYIPDRVFNTIWYHDFNEAIKKLLIGTDKKININF
ncbi:hypothetical protein [Chryseobacterium hagamense]|uniref:Uncharacterized protein n=1 Tax=Chryseobacterium hagamense TaxID=395935 RepID=A0A511YM32_9FLAO|nr:hypothetical protein [Chryseobacterium hagamense]GEN76258.1 hypothetical protein CHA01nite_19980 [Chryseobacterium hagamense]